MRISVAVVAVPLVAYAGPPQVNGPYANRRSKADVEQIKAVVSKEPGIDHRLKKIEAVRLDKVHIQMGAKRLSIPPPTMISTIAQADR